MQPTTEIQVRQPRLTYIAYRIGHVTSMVCTATGFAKETKEVVYGENGEWGGNNPEDGLPRPRSD